MKSRLLLPCAVLLVGICGCRSPQASGTASPGNPETTYRVSGVITDESGAPIPLATVVVDQGPHPTDADSKDRWVTRSTSHDGRFELILNPDRWQAGSKPSGLLRAWTENDEFRGYTQRLDWQGTNTVRNIRLRRIRTIDAGQSIDISVEADSPLCESGELSLETVCEWVRVRYPRNGTLTVEARSEAGAVPIVRNWFVAGVGTVSFPVSTGRSACAEVAIVLPVGSPPRKFSVSTSLTQQ